MKALHSYRKTTTLVIASLITVSWTAGIAQQIQVANSARYIGGGQYSWKLYLVAPDSVLDQIKYVEYTLHPSYAKPVVDVSDRSDGFALSSRGWGEFNVGVKVVDKSGHSTSFQHWLTLKSRKGWYTLPAQPGPDLHGPLATENTATHLANDRWQWTVYLVADDSTLAEIACVAYRLPPSFPNQTRQVCNRGPQGRTGFPLTETGWGSFAIGVQVTFRDGIVRNLEHWLRLAERPIAKP